MFPPIQYSLKYEYFVTENIDQQLQTLVKRCLVGLYIEKLLSGMNQTRTVAECW